MSSFLEFYDRMNESRAEFYVGDMLVTITEVSDQEFREATGELPNPRSLKDLAGPLRMKKWRVTYTINGQPVTNYLTAQTMPEARRMVWEFLQDKFDTGKVRPGGKGDFTRQAALDAEITPVSGAVGEDGKPDVQRDWQELLKLFKYSLDNDFKINHAKHKGDPNFPGVFASVDDGDFHQLLTFVQKHPAFVQEQLGSLEPGLRDHIVRAYNVAKKKVGAGQESRFGWGNRLKSLFDQHRKAFDKHFSQFRLQKKAVPQPPSSGVVQQSPPSADDQQGSDHHLSFADLMRQIHGGA